MRNIIQSLINSRLFALWTAVTLGSIMSWPRQAHGSYPLVMGLTLVYVWRFSYPGPGRLISAIAREVSCLICTQGSDGTYSTQLRVENGRRWSEETRLLVFVSLHAECICDVGAQSLSPVAILLTKYMTGYLSGVKI